MERSYYNDEKPSQKGFKASTMNPLFITTETLEQLVEPVDNEPLSYHVKSDPSNDYCDLVVCTDHHGNGSCSCPDYVYKKLPYINEGYELFTTQTQCKHIILAQEYWKRKSLHDVSKIMAQQNKRQ